MDKDWDCIHFKYETLVRILKKSDEELERHKQLEAQFEKEYEQIRKEVHQKELEREKAYQNFYEDYLSKLQICKERDIEIKDERNEKLERNLQIQRELKETQDAYIEELKKRTTNNN